MATNPPFILVPLAITDAMLTSSTVAEPAAGETAWVSAGNYVVGDRRIRVATHREYECDVAHTGITILPEDDPTRWRDIGPTLRWAMFDNTVSTVTSSTTSLTVVVEPGFFNASALYGLTGSNVSVTVKDAPAGATIYSYSGALDGPYSDWYDWLFGPYRQKTKLVLSGIVPYPDAELTITVSAATGAAVGIGMCCIGDMRPLILGDWGGMKYGAKAEPIDSSYIKDDGFGNLTIKKRRSATDMRVEIMLPREDADYALSVIQEVLAVPVACVATSSSGYDGLNVFGLVSGSVSYDSYGHANLSLYVKGMF